MAEKGYRSKVREAIKMTLNSSAHAMSVDEIHSGVENCDLSTVYRNLDRLVSDGSVIVIPDETGKRKLYQIARSGCFEKDHLHLKCSVCGRVYHIDCGQMYRFVEHLEKAHGFQINFSNAVLYGVCDKCAKESAPPSAK